MKYWRLFSQSHNVTKDGLSRYAKNTGWIFIGKFSNMAVGFLATLFVARSLGPTNYGELSYGLSFIALFSFIASLGIDSILYRELIKYPEKKNLLLGTAVGIKLRAAIFTTLITIISAWWFSSPDVSLILICILSTTFIFQIFGIISYEFGAAVNNKPVSLLSFAVTTIINTLKIIIVFFGKGVIYLAILVVIETLLYAIGYLYIRYKVFGSFTLWQFDYNIAKRLLLDSWPFIFISAFSVIYARIDQVMIKNMINATEVGIYDAAVRLTELWYFIPAIIVGSLFPAIVNAKKTNDYTYRKRVFSLITLLCLLTIIIASLVSLLAEPIVRIVFGTGFVESIPVLQTYIWALVPISLGVAAQHYLLAENARLTLFSMSLIGMMLNVAGNFLLIPQHQALGAATATLISSSAIIVFVCIMYLLQKINTVVR